MRNIRWSALAISLMLLQVLFVFSQTTIKSVDETRKAFKKLLDRPKLPLDVKQISKTTSGSYTYETVDFTSDKKADGSSERVPTYIVSPTEKKAKLPAVIMLHGTGGNKESQKSWLEEFAKRGWIGVAIDARHHGARSGGKKGSEAYNEAITKAWRAPKDKPQPMPFYFETCWDLWCTVDYLLQRDDVDPARIAMVGISMGGIQTWLAASVDERVAVMVPLIGVQSFKWTLENGKWQARANTIRKAHEAAASDMGEKEVNAKVCKELWNKIIPGILEEFDCPNMLKLCAPRPMLILNGEKDPNCPIEGARIAFASASEAYKKANVTDKLKIVEAAGVPHTVTPEFKVETLAWLERWLK